LKTILERSHVVAISEGSLGVAESAGPYHTKLRILFLYFLIKKCLRYFQTHITTYITIYISASYLITLYCTIQDSFEKKNVCVNKNPLNKRKILLNINYDVCSLSSFFLIASVKTNLN
jgi:hypothetical protein